jgi:hypothetical protein
MKMRWSNLFWGLALIVAGVLFLLQNLGYLSRQASEVWVFAFGGLSILFFLTYFFKGMQFWGWLFPTLAFGSLALTIQMGIWGINSSMMAIPILVSAGLPFLVAFALKPRARWWALIPAWAIFAVILIVLGADRIPGEAVGGLVLVMIGLPFLVVYLFKRRYWWALIPAGVMIVLGGITFLSVAVQGEFIGAMVLLGIALPFYVIYFTDRSRWWALIPAGVMTSVAVIPPLAYGLGGRFDNTGLLNGVMFLGLGATFLVLWLLRGISPTRWAIYPAAACGLVAVMSILLGGRGEILGPALIIGVGLLFIFFALRPRKII